MKFQRSGAEQRLYVQRAARDGLSAPAAKSTKASSCADVAITNPGPAGVFALPPASCAAVRHEIRRRGPLKVQAGNGGRGSTSFRREKFVPLGGPDGGDGGDGGSVYLRAAPGINTLADFRIAANLQGRSGEDGSGNGCTGRGGEDLYIPVPVGTMVRDAKPRSSSGISRRGRSMLKVAQRRQGRLGQYALQVEHQSRRRASSGPDCPARSARLSSSLRSSPTSACSVCRTPANPR